MPSEPQKRHYSSVLQRRVSTSVGVSVCIVALILGAALGFWMNTKGLGGRVAPSSQTIFIVPEVTKSVSVSPPPGPPRLTRPPAEPPQ